MTIALVIGVLGAALVTIVLLTRQQTTHSFASALTGVLAVAAIIALVLAPWVAVSAALATLATVVVDRTRTTRRVESEAQRAWPAVLDEISTRLVGFGDPLPDALFASTWALPRPLQHALSRAERLWRVSGDLQTAMQGVLDDVGPASRDTLRTLARLAHRSSQEAADVVATLAARHREEAALATDLRARLAGARLARSFVVAVPGLLLAVGVVIGGGPAPYLTTFGATVLTIAILIVAGCWAWADHYLEQLLTTGHRRHLATHALLQLARTRFR